MGQASRGDDGGGGGGLIAGEIGARWAGKHRKGAAAAGIGKPGDMKDLAEVFERAKSAAV